MTSSCAWETKDAQKKSRDRPFFIKFFSPFSGRPHPLGDATLLLQIVYVDEWLLLG